MSFYQSNLVEEQNLLKIFECKISGFELGKETENKLKEIQSTAHLKGFRKGKAPMSIIQEAYFGKIFFDVVNNKANSAIQEIAQKNDFQLASSPKVELDAESSLPADRNIANIKDVTMKVTYEILPQIPDLSFEAIKVEKYELNILEEDISEELKKLANAKGSKEEKDGAIEMRDVALIDAIGYMDGKDFEEGKVAGYELEIGSNAFIEGFETGLIGFKAGDDATLNLKFPDNYHAEHLSGKDVQFKVKILKVFKLVPAAIDDALAKQYGFENLDALIGDIKKSLNNSYISAYKNQQKNKIFENIESMLNFDVPPSMIVQKKEGEEESDADKSSKDPLSNARLSIFLMDHAQKNKIQVSQKDFLSYIEGVARMYGQNPMSMFDLYEKNEHLRESVYNLLFENKIYDHLFDLIPSEVKLISKKEFDEILKPQE